MLGRFVYHTSSVADKRYTGTPGNLAMGTQNPPAPLMFLPPFIEVDRQSVRVNGQVVGPPIAIHVGKSKLRVLVHDYPYSRIGNLLNIRSLCANAPREHAL